MATTKEYAFLSPGHNCWNVWMSGNSYTMTNPGTSHRILESLVYTIMELAKDRWEVDEICIEQGEPKLVLLVRAISVAEENSESEDAVTVAGQ